MINVSARNVMGFFMLAGHLAAMIMLKAEKHTMKNYVHSGCTKAIAENAGTIVKSIAGVALTIGTTVATNHFTDKKK